MSEKQRLKLEKFANKKEKQAQLQQAKEKESKKPEVPAVESKDWVEETPAGQKKILKPLDDDFHKAYVPKVVESAWYGFWEDQGLFKPQIEQSGSLKPKGKYVIAIPLPNVGTAVLTALPSAKPSRRLLANYNIGHALALSLEDTLIRWHRMRQFSTLYIPGCRHRHPSRCREAARQAPKRWQVQEAGFYSI
jgi:valyl-tRNA synthetase